MRRLGRFDVIRVLGEGHQGTVYLCNDPELERRVAVKLLHDVVPGPADGQPDCMDEARSISGLPHDNVVALFETGHQAGQPYLASDFIEGQTLKQHMRTVPIPTIAALEIIENVLAGMAHAHEHGILHRDLKPANIILNAGSVPKIADFGTARILSGRGGPSGELVGTPRYMAPEYIRSGRALLQSDVFSIGLVAYELLTGETAYRAQDTRELLRLIAEGPALCPTHFNEDIDETLEALLLKALHKDPFARFDDAVAMLAAWQEYRSHAPGHKEHALATPSTIEFLLQRIQNQNDFPALSHTVQTLNQLSRSEENNIPELTNLIVKDYGLTNKILKVVNSAYYGAFSGTIGTISRAIVVMGTSGIRSIAASLALLDYFSSRKDIARIKDRLGESLFSAIMARELMGEIDADASEEAFLGAMLHGLGHTLLTFYLPDEEAEICRLVAEETLDDITAQTRVLGTTYEKIGKAVASQWNFPRNIRQCLDHNDAGEVKPAPDAAGKLRLISGLSNELTSALRKAPPEERAAAVDSVKERYQKALGIGRKQLGRALLASGKEFIAFQTDFASGKDKKRFLKNIALGAGAAKTLASNAKTPQAEVSIVVDKHGQIDHRVTGGHADCEQLLSEGMQESAVLLVNRAAPTELLALVLETLYRGMRFNRIVACLFDRRRQRVFGHTGLGEDVQHLVGNFRFETTQSSDLFNLALTRGADIYIKDATKKSFQKRLPFWFHQLTRPGSFFILPLMAEDRLLGMLYAEYDRVDGFDEDPKVLSLIKALRSQLVLGIMSH